MTAQVHDIVIYKGEDYWLIGFEGDGLVKPEDFDMKPTSIITANWRGFSVKYLLADKGLFLREMRLTTKRDIYKPIYGQTPEIGEYGAHYQGLDVAVAFTGKMRLGKGFLTECYVHQGFQKASAFQTVLDFEVEKGRIVEVKDRSEEAGKIRGRYRKWYTSKGFSPTGTFKRIKDAYSLDMDLK